MRVCFIGCGWLAIWVLRYRLLAMDDKDFLTLRKASGLAITYAQRFAMIQLAVLGRLGDLQGQILAQTVESEAGDLTGFSLSKNEVLLIFE